MDKFLAKLQIIFLLSTHFSLGYSFALGATPYIWFLLGVLLVGDTWLVYTSDASIGGR